MLTDLLLFSNMSTNKSTRWKQDVKRMCLNGITCTGTHQVKKVSYCHAHRSFSVLIHNIIYYVYECFGEYCASVHSYQGAKLSQI